MGTGSLFTQQLSTADFELICRQVYDYCGINIAPAKRQMVEGRLRKRLLALGLPSFAEYCSSVFGDSAFQGEFVHLVDAITTNKTEFFREPGHFAYLTNELLPALHRAKFPLRRPLRVWSSACSTGQEPYSLAMELDDFKRKYDGFDFWVHATDISTQVLGVAVRAIYSDELAADIPGAYRKRYLLRSKDSASRLIRIGPEMRRCVKFSRLNLNESDYGQQGKMDIIFCRNVIIYFDARTQEAILKKLALCLRIGGHLFLGHSETIHGMELPVRAIAPTIYERI